MAATSDTYSIRTATADFEDVADTFDLFLSQKAEVELTASISTTSTTGTDYTSASIALTTRANQVVLVGFNALISSGAPTGSYMWVTQDGTLVGTSFIHITPSSASTAGNTNIITAHRLVVPSVGAHTYKLRWQTDSGTIYSTYAYLYAIAFTNT